MWPASLYQRLILATKTTWTVRSGAWWTLRVAQNSIFTRESGAWKESAPGKAFARSGTTDKVKRLFVRKTGAWENVWAFFFGAIVPDADIETSDWSGTPLYLKLNEDVPDDATTQISAGFVGDGGQTKDFEIGFSNPIIPPTAGETVTIRVRMWLDILAFGVSFKVATMTLKENAQVKLTFGTNLDTSGYLTREHVMTQAEKDSITNWNNLRLKVSFAVTGDNIFAASTGRVTWIEMRFTT